MIYFIRKYDQVLLCTMQNFIKLYQLPGSRDDMKLLVGSSIEAFKQTKNLNSKLTRIKFKT